MRDESPKAVAETLAQRVGNPCSNPECQKRTSGPHTDKDRALNVGVAAHVTASSPGGPRYDPSLTPDEQKRREQWHDLLRVWAVDPIKADQKFDEVCRSYAGPGRFYHTLDHVMDVIKTLETLSSYVKHPNTVKLAAWLHDVIYDSMASNNEERSAQYAERLCEELSIPEGSLVGSLILKTKTHEAGEDVDAQVLIDTDLAILGASDTVYRDYAEKIRLEYGWVPEMEYRSGRRRVLESFLARPRIYHLLSHLEEAARRNIAAEIAQLA